jgi:hypothetical protein
MNRISARAGWAAAWLLALGGAACAQAPNPGLLVGVAAVDVTPPVGHRVSGSYQEVVSTGVNEPLYAKALVLRQGDAAATASAPGGAVLCGVAPSGRGAHFGARPFL